jgi:prefoldin subunit 5
MARRTVMSQLTSAGETALEQLATSPVTRKAVESAIQLKDRVEKLVTSIGDVDKRLAALEKRVEALEKAKRTRARATTSGPSRTTTPRTTRAKS